MLDTAAARRVAADLLSRRPWTVAELAARLRRRGAPSAVASEVVADLTARGYLDDAAFARHWVEIRAARGYGPARLRAELRLRGVAPALIGSALASIVLRDTADEVSAAAGQPALRLTGSDAGSTAAPRGDAQGSRALEAARAVAARRLPALRRVEPDRVAARLRDYLLRRGYPASVAIRVAREVAQAPTDQVQ